MSTSHRCALSLCSESLVGVLERFSDAWSNGSNVLLSLWEEMGIELKMRPHGDFTPDDELKKQWLDELTAQERARLTAVFDDRDKVVQMWRENGVCCAQVAPGAF